MLKVHHEVQYGGEDDPWFPEWTAARTVLAMKNTKGYKYDKVLSLSMREKICSMRWVQSGLILEENNFFSHQIQHGIIIM